MYAVVVFGLLCFASADAAGWGYKDAASDLQPERWKDLYATCNGQEQSPIDIRTSGPDAAEYDANLGKFTLTGWNTEIAVDTIEMVNVGHAVQWQVPTSLDIQVKDGGLPGTYQLRQFHIHWGYHTSSGSEHQIDGRSHAAEMHFVNYNKAYDDMVVLNQRDGLAVLGVFIEEDPYMTQDDADFGKLIANIENIMYKDQTQMVNQAFKLEDLLPSNTEDYYRYMGGLTTPECNQVVVWTVFSETYKVSTAQMNKFRDTLYQGGQGSPGNVIKDNFRPVQPLYDREVTKSFKPEEPEPKDNSGASLSAPFCLMAAILSTRHLL